MPDSIDDQVAYIEKLNLQEKTYTEYIKQHVKQSDRVAYIAQLSNLLEKLKKKDIDAFGTGLTKCVNDIFFEFETCIDEDKLNAKLFDVDQVISKAFKDLEVNADHGAAVNELVQDTYQKDSVSAPAPYEEKIAEGMGPLNEQYTFPVPDFNQKLTQAQTRLEAMVREIVSAVDDQEAWQEQLEALMSELKTRGKEVLDEVYNSDSEENIIETLNNNLEQVLQAFQDNVGQLNDTQNRMNAQIQCKDGGLGFFNEKLNQRIGNIRTIIVKRLQGALWLDESDIEYYNSEGIEPSTKSDIADFTETMSGAFKLLESNVGKALALLEEYSKNFTEIKERTSNDKSQQASFNELLLEIIWTEEYLKGNIAEALLMTGDKARERLEELDKNMGEFVTYVQLKYAGQKAPSVDDPAEATSEESVAESDKVYEPSEPLTRGQRIKAIVAQGERAPGYSEKTAHDKLKYILSELFSPGESGEDNSESLEEKSRKSQGRVARSVVLGEEPPPPPPRKQPPRTSTPRIPISEDIIPKDTVKRAREELLKKGFRPRSPSPDLSEKKEGDKAAQTKLLMFLKSYLDTLKKHEKPDHPVRAQLVRTIQTMESDFIDKEEPPVSPRSVAYGPGASEPAAVEQGVTPEKHLELLKELDKKLEGLLEKHKAQLPQATQEALVKLQAIVKQSIDAVQKQVMKDKVSAIKSTSEDVESDLSPEYPSPKNCR